MESQELRRHTHELRRLTGLKIEVVSAAPQVFVVLRDAPLPPGAYQIAFSDVLFITDEQYPLSAMDMFWTDLAVLKPDGSVPQNADSIETYIDRQWRRFSWHRNGIWDPGRNGMVDHYEFMQSRFAVDVAPGSRQ